MKIRLSGVHGKSAETLGEVVDRTCRESGMSDDQVLLCMSYFFEALADDVARGRIVTVPGFGVFGAVFIRKARKQPPAMLPRFSPSVGFVRQTRLCAPQSTKGNIALDYHARNHHASSAPMTARVGSAAENFRMSIRKQMAQD